MISSHYTRTSVMIFILCLCLGMTLHVDHVMLYHSLFSFSSIDLLIDQILYVTAALVLSFLGNSYWREQRGAIKSEYSFIVMFVVLGATIIISSNDFISMYLSLELQSFALYIVACIYCDMKSTRASLKYFLLGAISSAFILLGISIMYSVCGTTDFQDIIPLLIYGSHAESQSSTLILGVISLLCGFIFKISAAPFHSWAPDVYDDVPSHITLILITLPKLALFSFLIHFLQNIPNSDQFLIIIGIASLIWGTVAGLSQTKLKRLLTFSTISHVGFLIIALSIINTSAAEQGLNALLFYIIQYMVTTCLTFIVIIAFEQSYVKHSIDKMSDLIQVSSLYKLLTFTLVLCLFSMSGIPPLVGFYAKLEVLRSSVTENTSLIYIIAIACSVISASYYMRIIKIMMFDEVSASTASSWYPMNISSLHSYIISVLIVFISLYILDPSLLINSTELAALTYYIS